MNLSNLTAAGSDVIGFDIKRPVEMLFAPQRSAIATALGGEPLGADARAARDGDTANGNFRDSPDAYFGTKKPFVASRDVTGETVLPFFGAVPMWAIWAGGALVVLLGLRLLKKKG